MVCRFLRKPDCSLIWYIFPRKMQRVFLSVFTSRLLTEVSYALRHHVLVAIVKVGFTIVSSVPIQACCNASSDVIEDVSSVAGLVLQRIFSRDHFLKTGKKRNRHLHISCKDGAKWFVWIVKVLLLFKLSCLTKEKENEYIFRTTWNAHCGLIAFTRNWTAYVERGQPLMK